MNFLRKINADLAVVIAYGQIIPKEYLKLTKKGFLNIHASILPNGDAAQFKEQLNLDEKLEYNIINKMRF